MTVREKSPTILTEIGARRLTDRLRVTLTEAHELLIDAFTGRAWEALGYPTWQAYCATELGDLLHVRLPVAMRRQAAAQMRQAGMSYRDVALPLGVTVATIHADLNPRAAKPAPPVDTRTAVERAVAAVRAQGDRGLTCLEYEEESGQRHGAASAALCKAERRGLVRRVAVFRRGYAAYVA